MKSACIVCHNFRPLPKGGIWSQVGICWGCIEERRPVRTDGGGEPTIIFWPSLVAGMDPFEAVCE